MHDRMKSSSATANSCRLEDPRCARANVICRALSLSSLSAANCQRFEQQRRSPNLNRLSLMSVARSMNFAPADFNRSSTEPELSFIQISDARRFRSEAIRALTEIGSGYSNLEYDLATGERGRRGAYIENALALLCEAEAATVVNNCAAALVLIVHHFDESWNDQTPNIEHGTSNRSRHFTWRTGANRRRISHWRNYRSERREIARGRRHQQNNTRRLRARHWSQDRDDSESSSQQFFHERFCRIAFFERDQRARRRKSGFRLSRIWAAAR